jgi:hypothetical protein
MLIPHEKTKSRSGLHSPFRTHDDAYALLAEPAATVDRCLDPDLLRPRARAKRQTATFRGRSGESVRAKAVPPGATAPAAGGAGSRTAPGGARPCPRKARGTAASGPPPVGCGRHLPAWQGVADACSGAAHANSRHTPRSASSEKITATDTVQTQQTTERDRLGGCASSAPVEEKLDWPKT